MGNESVKHIAVIDPNDLKQVKETLDAFVNLDEPSVIITRWPCVLKKLSQEDKEEFTDVFKTKCHVEIEKCIGCKLCLKTGCPAIRFNADKKKAFVLSADCVGCDVCAQVCPKNAIVK